MRTTAKNGRQKGRKQTGELQGKVGIKKEPKLRNVEKKGVTAKDKNK